MSCSTLINTKGMTAIIILNWNGYNDTIECLRSLYRMTSSFFVVVADNGSSDASVNRIREFLEDENIDVMIVKRGNALTEKPNIRSCIIYDIGENLGFARGNNESIRLISPMLPDYYLLLNNDTIVESDFLDRLTEFIVKHHDIEALTPLICYNSDRNRIWNCGGKQFLGLRKYYYANQTLMHTKDKEYIRVSFLTGCALFFSPSLLNEDGSIFTEDFFFGEEDFNFCLRMNREKRGMACVLTSKIYHKVGNSINKDCNIGKTYIHYLNRFIDVRRNTSRLKYRLWTLLYSLYVMSLLLKKNFTLSDTLMLLRKTKTVALQKDKVSKADFINALAAHSVKEL